MSKIRKPYEIEGKKTIFALIYGQSGVGKTTLACSAEKPVLFDFDGGVARIRNEHQVPTVQVEKWEDAECALEELKDNREFSTVIIDTVSKMYDCIMREVVEGNRMPRIQDYGKGNAIFNNFIKSVLNLEKNVIMIAQRSVIQDGDILRYEPDIRTGNYKFIICDLDLCGYVEMMDIKGKQSRVITFDPTSRNEGKNTGGFMSSYEIQTLDNNQQNNFFSHIFNNWFNFQRQSEAERYDIGKKAQAVVDQFSMLVANATAAEDINMLIDDWRAMEPVGDAKVRCKRMLGDRAKELGLKPNKETGRYE